MEVTIAGKHLDIGDTLRQHIESNLLSRVKRYFENAIHAHVTISKNHNLFHSNVIIHEGSGRSIIIKSNHEDADAYHSIDGAIQKAEKQLKKYKERLKSRHKVRSIREPEIIEELTAKKYVLAAKQNQENDRDEFSTVIAEKQASLQKFAVSDAIMHMDLMDLTTLLFINAESGMLSVLYHRKDGNIAWIETQVPYIISK